MTPTEQKKLLDAALQSLDNIAAQVEALMRVLKLFLEINDPEGNDG